MTDFISQNYKALLVGYGFIGIITVIAIHSVYGVRYWQNLINQILQGIDSKIIFKILLLIALTILGISIQNKYSHIVPAKYWTIISVSLVVIATCLIAYKRSFNIILIGAFLLFFGLYIPSSKHEQPNSPENIIDVTPNHAKPIKQIDKMQNLIASLEASLLPKGAKIKAQDYIEDRVTGQLRRVDISIRKQVGSIPVLIIIDCKDKNIINDIEWIEKLAQKRDAIHAEKAVAVTYDKFSDSALRKADFMNIETRSLNEITPSDISEWCKIETMTLSNYRVEYINVKIFLETSPELYSQAQNFLKSVFQVGKMDTEAKIFTTGNSKDIFDINSIWNGMFPKHRTEGYKGVEPNGPKIRRTFIPNFTNPREKLQLILDNKKIEIKELELTCDIWIERTEIPLSWVSKYSSEEESFIDSAGWEFEVNGKKYSFYVNKDIQTGQFSLMSNNISDVDFGLVFQKNNNK